MDTQMNGKMNREMKPNTDINISTMTVNADMYRNENMTMHINMKRPPNRIDTHDTCFQNSWSHFWEKFGKIHKYILLYMI